MKRKNFSGRKATRRAGALVRLQKRVAAGIGHRWAEKEIKTLTVRAALSKAGE